MGIHLVVEPPRAPTSASLNIPASLRALVRRNEIGLIGLGLCVGAIAGILTSGVLMGSGLLHYLLYGVPLHKHLSTLESLSSPWQGLIPMIGGLVLGLAGLVLQKWMKTRPVDPIEANALHGGQMSLADSLVITGQTVLSSGCGASVGLEAAYTQISSGFASWLGARFHLRRSDMRTLVGCGSAGAIAAAFGAPLTGAFYAFELVLGTYTPFGLAPVGAAAVAGVLASRTLGAGGDFMGHVGSASTLTQMDMVFLLGLGVICAGLGIGIMRAVTFVEQIFKASRLPLPLHPMVGGLIVGGLALLSPHVLASGHGALFGLFDEGAPTFTMLIEIFLLKAMASSVSIGAGFRGGLFFASLYLGAMLGKIYCGGISLFDPILAPDPWVCAIVGMSALAGAIIGGPLTMSFLALETTGDVPLSLAMLAVSAVVSVIVRRSFGYSFATWRLHLRGESIRSAQDIGWIRDLTVGRLMRLDVHQASSELSLEQFREKFPLGSTQWVVMIDLVGIYKGMVSVIEAYLADRDQHHTDRPLADLIRHKDDVLIPEMNIKTAAQMFEQCEAEALAVVKSLSDQHVVGLLTEAHVLRRYTEQLDSARRELVGERDTKEA